MRGLPKAAVQGVRCEVRARLGLLFTARGLSKCLRSLGAEEWADRAGKTGFYKR